MNKRDFLKLSAVSACGFNLLSPKLYAANQNPNKTLVLVEFNGGNDGLNTLIPYTDSRYYDLRPNISINRNNVIQLNEKLGLHPALKPIQSIWSDSNCAIVKGVGYPQPNRSHFRSIEIWESASDSDETIQSGWLNQVLPQTPLFHQRVVDGVVLGQGSGPLTGELLRTVSLKQKTNNFKSNQANQLEMSPALRHVLDIQTLLDDSSRYFKQQLKPLKGQNNFAQHAFAKDMKLAAQIIASGAHVPVIKTSLGSFDTHGSQLNTHQRLLKQFAEGIKAFEKTMKQNGMWNNVIIMTYSEFGRRAKENGSKGTDHGTAAPHFVFGGSVKGGFYGKQPSLKDLNNNDLKHHVDFRQMYSSLEKNWFGVSAANAKNFKPIPFI